MQLIKIKLKNQQVIIDDYTHLDALLSYARVLQTGNVEDRWDIPIKRIYSPANKDRFVFDCSVWFGNILGYQNHLYTKSPFRGYSSIFSLDSRKDTAFVREYIPGSGRSRNFLFALRHTIINEICFIFEGDADEISRLLRTLPGIGKKKVGKIKTDGIAIQDIGKRRIPGLYRTIPADIAKSDNPLAKYGYRSPYWHIDNQTECHMPPVPLERANWLKEICS